MMSEVLEKDLLEFEWKLWNMLTNLFDCKLINFNEYYDRIESCSSVPRKGFCSCFIYFGLKHFDLIGCLKMLFVRRFKILIHTTLRKKI